ncbi:MAG: hypothetical protein ACXV3F_13275 [Frankiaceae bacterium]
MDGAEKRPYACSNLVAAVVGLPAEGRRGQRGGLPPRAVEYRVDVSARQPAFGRRVSDAVPPNEDATLWPYCPTYIR